jgi:sulfite reductase alpha subunit
MAESKTPLLDELEKGPWPSFVADIKMAAKRKATTMDLLNVLELSYKEKIVHWKHGGIVGVMGYGGGVVGRYVDQPDKFPGVENFHTIRVNQPAGWYYSSTAMRTLCDIWDKHGSGMTNFHGSTGDIILLGTNTDALQPCFDDLSEAGFDLGGSGSALRTPSTCAGPGRCEWACYDNLQVCYDLTQKYQMELHRPMWPYKFKMKFSGCPNDCVASVARSDMAFIGTWRDAIRVDAAAVKAYAAGELKANGGAHEEHVKLDIQKDVVDLCPTQCMSWDGDKLSINNAECNRCMHCINCMPRALRPGADQGCTILLGAKAPILNGALMSSVIIPFMPREKMTPVSDELAEFIENTWEFWDENAKFRERIGEMIERIGLRVYLKGMGIKAIPQMVKEPRSNPYFFWWPEELGLESNEEEDDD